MLQVTQIARFLLEGGLRFRNLGFCGQASNDGDSDLQCTGTGLPGRTRLSRLFPAILEGHGAFVCDRDLALTVRIRDLNRRFGGLQVSPRLRFA
jgi:hypothetical protein